MTSLDAAMREIRPIEEKFPAVLKEYAWQHSLFLLFKDRILSGEADPTRFWKTVQDDLSTHEGFLLHGGTTTFDAQPLLAYLKNHDAPAPTTLLEPAPLTDNLSVPKALLPVFATSPVSATSKRSRKHLEWLWELTWSLSKEDLIQKRMALKKFNGLVRCCKTAAQIQAVVALRAFHEFFINRCKQAPLRSYPQTLNEIGELVKLHLPQPVKNAVHDSLWKIVRGITQRTITPSESDSKRLRALLQKELGSSIQFKERDHDISRWITYLKGMSIECLKFSDHLFTQEKMRVLTEASSIKKLIFKRCVFEEGACQPISKIRNLEQVHYVTTYNASLDLAKALAAVSTLQCLIWDTRWWGTGSDLNELFSIFQRGISHIVIKRPDWCSDATTQFINAWDKACREKGIPLSLRVIERTHSRLSLHHYQFNEIPFDKTSNDE